MKTLNSLNLNSLLSRILKKTMVKKVVDDVLCSEFEAAVLYAFCARFVNESSAPSQGCARTGLLGGM